MKFIAFFSLLLPLQLMGQSKIHTHSLSEGYELSIYIPGNYTKSKNYPVVYFNDGNWLFHSNQGLSLKIILDSLISNDIIDPMLIVGVDQNTDRKNRFIPYHDSWITNNMGAYQPQVELYTRKLCDLVIPYIEHHYAVDGHQRALFGFSFGGLHALWAGMNTECFAMVAGFSPSLWTADYRLINDRAVKRHGNLKNVWFDIGTREWNYYVPYIETLVDFGIEKDHIFYYEVVDGIHTMQSWKHRLGYPLQIFSGRYKNKIESIQLIKECIPSQSTASKVYQRLNAVGEDVSGVQITLAKKAKYEIINGDGTIMDDGRYEVYDESMRIRVSYQDIQVETTLKNCR